MSIRGTIAVTLGALALASCTPRVSVVSYDRTAAPKPAGCDLDVYSQYDDIPFLTKVLAEIDVGDTGFSVNCSADDVMEVIEEEACAVGADAIRLTNIQYPDARSTCFRTTALLLRYEGPGHTDAAAIRAPAAPTPRAAAGSLVLTDLSQLEGARIVADDGTFLGVITQNPFVDGSLANRYGDHGGKYASESILNRYGSYGSAFSAYSPFNRFSTTPPRVFVGDEFAAYLTANELMEPRVDPYALIAWIASRR